MDGLKLFEYATCGPVFFWKRRKKSSWFSNKNGYVWTGPKSAMQTTLKILKTMPGCQHLKSIEKYLLNINWKRKTCNLHLGVIPHLYVNYCTYTLTLFDTRIFIFWRRWGFLRRRRRHRVQITITYRNRMFLSIPLLFYQFFRQVSVYFRKFLAKDKKQCKYQFPIWLHVPLSTCVQRSW